MVHSVRCASIAHSPAQVAGLTRHHDTIPQHALCLPLSVVPRACRRADARGRSRSPHVTRCPIGATLAPAARESSATFPRSRTTHPARHEHHTPTPSIDPVGSTSLEWGSTAARAACVAATPGCLRGPVRRRAHSAEGPQSAAARPYKVVRLSAANQLTEAPCADAGNRPVPQAQAVQDDSVPVIVPNSMDVYSRRMAATHKPTTTHRNLLPCLQQGPYHPEDQGMDCSLALFTSASLHDSKPEPMNPGRG